jgi:hypothetical protein
MIGIQGEALMWFESYLEGRSQVVKINRNKSREEQNDLGVPQGSIIGPLLFIMYVNDHRCVLHWLKMKKFADDTLLYIETANLQEAIPNINNDLRSLFSKINQDKLKLNVEKTKLMLITNKKQVDKSELIIQIDDTVLQFEKEIKYLGIVIDDKLSFKANVDYVAKKIGKKVGVLSR